MTNFEKSLDSGRNKFVIVVVFDYVLVLIMCFFDIFVIFPCISVEAVCLHICFDLHITI